MAIGTMEEAMSTHPFFSGLEPKLISTLVSCARNRVFHPGEYLCREGEEADSLHLIGSGQVTLEVYAAPHGALRIETLQEGDVLGWSWLMAPYRWHFDARAVATVRTLALDARCLRDRCELDHELGYQLLTRISSLIEERLQTMRSQLLEVYGHQDCIATRGVPMTGEPPVNSLHAREQ
jgi:CRP/FNR family transcriptional regulator, cyclic AMP receptor protein